MHILTASCKSIIPVNDYFSQINHQAGNHRGQCRWCVFRASRHRQLQGTHLWHCKFNNLQMDKARQMSQENPVGGVATSLNAALKIKYNTHNDQVVFNKHSFTTS